MDGYLDFDSYLSPSFAHNNNNNNNNDIDIDIDIDIDRDDTCTETTSPTGHADPNEDVPFVITTTDPHSNVRAFRRRGNNSSTADAADRDEFANLQQYGSNNIPSPFILLPPTPPPPATITRVLAFSSSPRIITSSSDS